MARTGQAEAQAGATQCMHCFLAYRWTPAAFSVRFTTVKAVSLVSRRAELPHVDRVVNSHCHEDHVAGNHLFPDVPWHVHEADLPGLQSFAGFLAIFGYDDPRTREYAVELGLALQLTNILRDVGADAARDRLYLPLEDLARHGVAEEALLAAARGASAPRPPGLGALLSFEAERARAQYARAAALLPERDRRAMLAAEIMGAVYRTLLEEWARR